MRNDWRIVSGFPSYLVNPLAQVMNARTESLIRQTPVNYGVLSVVLYKNGLPSRRSLAKIVANEFVLRPTRWCDTPIHLDGQRANCKAENLMWRPRHIAIRYHQQFLDLPTLIDPQPIVCLTTGEQFKSVHEAAFKYGLIVHELVDCIWYGRPTWPDKLVFIFM